MENKNSCSIDICVFIGMIVFLQKNKVKSKQDIINIIENIENIYNTAIDDLDMCINPLKDILENELKIKLKKQLQHKYEKQVGYKLDKQLEKKLTKK